MSVRDLKGHGRWWALAGCLLWLAFTLFPLYWVAITSFKIAARAWSADRPTCRSSISSRRCRPGATSLRRHAASSTTPSSHSTIVGLSASLHRDGDRLDGGLCAGALHVRVKLLSGLIFFVVALRRLSARHHVFGLRHATMR